MTTPRPLNLRRHEASTLAEHGVVTVAREMKPQPKVTPSGGIIFSHDAMNHEVFWGDIEAIAKSVPLHIRCPFGRVGDVLWCREAYARRDDFDWRANLSKTLHYIHYRADYDGDLADEWHDYGKWRPASSMPVCLSRFNVVVESVECRPSEPENRWTWFATLRRVEG